MKKKIAEFDNYGVNLSKTCQHKTIPGGIFSIILIAYSIYTIIGNVVSYLKSPNHIAMKYLIDFQYPLAKVNMSSDNVNGTISIMGNSNISMDYMFRYFKLAFEYNVDSSYTNTKIIMLECVFKANNNNKCSFNLPLQNEFFTYNHYSYYKPRITLQSCRSFKKQINVITNSYLLNDCVDDQQIDDIYLNNEILQKYFVLNIGTPNYQILNNGTVIRFQKENNLLFRISKPNATSPIGKDSYIMEVEKMNVFYQNKLFSYAKKNYTYISWQNPKMSNIELDDHDDFILNIIFSFRLQEEMKFYYVTKTSFYDTVIAIGGFLGLVGVIVLIPKLWLGYYYQKVLFQVYYHDKKDKEISDVDWKHIGYCQWYWLTCCCNPDKRKKAIKMKFNELLKEYQCISCIKTKQYHRWFDLSRIMKEEGNNEHDGDSNDNFLSGNEFKEMEHL